MKNVLYKIIDILKCKRKSVIVLNDNKFAKITSTIVEKGISEHKKVKS